MGMVMIKCPETGSSIPTGIETDRERFRCSAVFFAHLLQDMRGYARVVRQRGLGLRNGLGQREFRGRRSSGVDAA